MHSWTGGVRAISRIWTQLPFFQCPILGVWKYIWDQTFCITELSSRVRRVVLKPCKAFKIDKIKFDSNIHLILDVFPPVILSKITCVATSHSNGVMVNATSRNRWGDSGVRAKPEFVYQDCVKIIGHGGAHKHNCTLKSLSIQNTCSITTFLPKSLTTCLKSKIKNTFKVKWIKLQKFFSQECLLPDVI